MTCRPCGAHTRARTRVPRALTTLINVLEHVVLSANGAARNSLGCSPRVRPRTVSMGCRGAWASQPRLFRAAPVGLIPVLERVFPSADNAHQRARTRCSERQGRGGAWASQPRLCAAPLGLTCRPFGAHTRARMRVPRALTTLINVLERVVLSANGAEVPGPHSPGYDLPPLWGSYPCSNACSRALTTLINVLERVVLSANGAAHNSLGCSPRVRPRTRCSRTARRCLGLTAQAMTCRPCGAHTRARMRVPER